MANKTLDTRSARAAASVGFPLQSQALCRWEPAHLSIICLQRLCRDVKLESSRKKKKTGLPAEG